MKPLPLYRVPWALTFTALRAAIDGAYRGGWQDTTYARGRWAGSIAAQQAEWVGWKWKAAAP